MDVWYTVCMSRKAKYWTAFLVGGAPVVFRLVRNLNLIPEDILMFVFVPLMAPVAVFCGFLFVIWKESLNYYLVMDEATVKMVIVPLLCLVNGLIYVCGMWLWLNFIDIKYEESDLLPPETSPPTP